MSETFDEIIRSLAADWGMQPPNSETLLADLVPDSFAALEMLIRLDENGAGFVGADQLNPSMTVSELRVLALQQKETPYDG